MTIFLLCVCVSLCYEFVQRYDKDAILTAAVADLRLWLHIQQKLMCYFLYMCLCCVYTTELATSILFINLFTI